ncbi:hypothetical protein CRUP_002195 [Coryphaenoides rupestris]|nr:hypothetical protein CRUP_002195 [Coryphaenoides rupestris]
MAGKYDCVDVNECDAGAQKCSHHATCLNTEGSYRCRCKPGFRGNGFECSVKPFYQRSWDGEQEGEGGADELNAIPEPPARTLDNERIRNLIPEPTAAAPRPTRSQEQPFDYDGEVYIGSQDGAEEEEEDGEGGEEEEEHNQLNPRGDVFAKVSSAHATIPTTTATPTPQDEKFILDCNFDQGACEWVQDKSDDMEWSVAYHELGGQYYMAMSGLLGDLDDVARLKLLLSDRAQQGSFCLTFDFRVAGQGVGMLRVLLDNNVYPVEDDEGLF